MEELTLDKRIRLSAMMFLQYMYFAVFFVPLAAYVTNMGVKGILYATILSSMPLGNLASPIVCMIADRHFSSQKVLAVLNLICAVLLFIAANVTSPILLFLVLLLAMFCHMPTWSLANAIALAHSPQEKFPQIRALGSIGWFASGIFGLVALKMFDKKIDGTAIPLYCGAVTALITAALNLTLPHTPPPAKGRKASFMDALGLPALKLVKSPNFAAFIILSMLVMIPFVTYFSFGSQFFDDQGFELVTATMNWGQLVEMLFLMLLVPFLLARFGVKWTMVIGIAGLVFRYLMFWAGSKEDVAILYYLAILIHGLIFGCFFVGGQVYIDKKAPPEIRAQAQGLIGLLCFGVGWLVGNYVNALLIDHYKIASESGVMVTDWQSIWKIITALSVVLLVAFAMLFRDDVSRAKVAVAAEEAMMPPTEDEPKTL
jgi:nucleoside transporter